MKTSCIIIKASQTYEGEQERLKKYLERYVPFGAEMSADGPRFILVFPNETIDFVRQIAMNMEAQGYATGYAQAHSKDESIKKAEENYRFRALHRFSL